MHDRLFSIPAAIRAVLSATPAAIHSLFALRANQGHFKKVAGSRRHTDGVLKCVLLLCSVAATMSTPPHLPSVAVVTSATAAKPSDLAACLRSVQAQTYHGVLEHWVIVNGFERARHVIDTVTKTLAPPTARPIRMTHLPNNSTHLVFSGFAFLVDAQYVVRLDECATFDPDHIDALMMAKGTATWAHSFRRFGNGIVDVDDCLGGVMKSSRGGNRIDPNCYLLRRDLAMELAPAWTMPDPERSVARMLLATSGGGISRSASVCVSSSSSASLSARYDFVGKRDVYVFHLFPRATKEFVASPSAATREKNILDGYENIEMIPPGAVCVSSVWRADALPLDMLRKRAGDITRVAIMCEGPLPRHRRQWTKSFLEAHFDVVFACWMPLVSSPPQNVRVEWCPHPCSIRRLATNRSVGRSIGTVGFLDSHGEGAWTTYDIDGTCLETLEVVREAYTSGLRDVAVYDVETGETPVRFLSRFAFALVVEECAAEGYVSEKLYDAFIAGCVPLYYASGIVPPLGIPGDTYIDIRAFEDGTALQLFLDGLSDDAVRAFRMRVDRARGDILERAAFDTVFRRTTALSP